MEMRPGCYGFLTGELLQDSGLVRVIRKIRCRLLGVKSGISRDSARITPRLPLDARGRNVESDGV